jgi:predicted nuclease of predicted toxin-antitoxin system
MSPPRFLLDEHVWGGLVDIGQEAGVDVLLVQTRLPPGTTDEEVLVLAASQERILLTSNAQDFAPLVTEWFLAEREHWGVLSCRDKRIEAYSVGLSKTLSSITLLIHSRTRIILFRNLSKRGRGH